jgi:hypothetical protein
MANQPTANPTNENVESLDVLVMGGDPDVVKLFGEYVTLLPVAELGVKALNVDLAQEPETGKKYDIVVIDVGPADKKSLDYVWNFGELQEPYAEVIASTSAPKELVENQILAHNASRVITHPITRDEFGAVFKSVVADHLENLAYRAQALE